ncbi:MAG: hypothetical protein J6A37_12830 [Oscillospiraceae bacterium]|nr:hypothetical protein [Oscillospiraceae bacterium]
MAKKKIKIDLSGGWRDVLEQAIDVNDVYAIESDLEDETAMEITDRNFIIFSKLIHYIREDDTILFSPSEIRVLLRILMEDFVHLQNDLRETSEILSESIDVVKSYKELVEEIIDEYGLDIDGD